MAIVMLAIAEYAVILGIRFGRQKNKIKAQNMEDEEAIIQRCKRIDAWALKIFIGMDVLTMGTYFYCVNSFV